MSIPVWGLILFGFLGALGWVLFFWKRFHVTKVLAEAETHKVSNDNLQRGLRAKQDEMERQDTYHRELQAQWDSVPDEIRREIVSRMAKEKVANEIAQAVVRRQEKNKGLI